MLEFDVQIKSDDLYDYMMRHTYNSAAGILGSGVGGVVAVAGTLNGQWLFILAGMLLLLYLPWTLFIRSKKQALTNPSFKQPLHYVMEEEGISVSQGEEMQMLKWEDMHKAVSTNRSIIVYTSAAHACIFPKRDLADKTVQAVQIISTHMPAAKVKIRNI